MKQFFLFLLLATCLSCGEDRSGEQPLAPTVKTLGAIVTNHQAELSGAVLASPNSKLQACGFVYGSDPKKWSYDTLVPAPSLSFSVTTRHLPAGTYYYAAYARNGMGKSWGDTLSFEVP